MIGVLLSAVTLPPDTNMSIGVLHRVLDEATPFFLYIYSMHGDTKNNIIKHSIFFSMISPM